MQVRIPTSKGECVGWNPRLRVEANVSLERERAERDTGVRFRAAAQMLEIAADFLAQKPLTAELKSRRVPAEKRNAESCLEIGPLPCLNGQVRTTSQGRNEPGQV